MANLTLRRCSVVRMKIGPAHEYADGWEVAVAFETAAEPMQALDPAVPFVVIEGYSPLTSDKWQKFPVSLSDDGEEPRLGLVRGVRFDLLMSPAEAVASAPRMDRYFQGSGFYMWQSDRRPPEYLHLLQLEHPARTAAIKGVGVSLLINVHHVWDTGIMWSPTHEGLLAAVERLRASDLT